MTLQEKYGGRKIKHVVCRWMKEEKCHKEFIIFEDGTEMEKISDQEMMNQIQQKQIDTPKVS